MPNLMVEFWYGEVIYDTAETLDDVKCMIQQEITTPSSALGPLIDADVYEVDSAADFFSSEETLLVGHFHIKNGEPIWYPIPFNAKEAP